MTRTLLVIDDDDDIREIAQLALEVGSSWRVVTAASGAEGLATAIAELPDGILLDVMMPEMDGPATLERLRADERTRLIPIIFLTAKAHSADGDRLGALDVTGVLPKPFDPIALPAQIAALLRWTL